MKAVAEPVMLAVDGAASALLPLLLKQSERHAEVFSTEIVRELIAFKWDKYGRRLFLRETGLHLALVLSWQWVTVHDAQTEDIMFVDVPVAEGLAAATLCAAAGIGADRLARCMPRFCFALLGITAAVACTLVGQLGSTSLPVLLVLVLLTMLTARAVANEIRQLANVVPSVMEFNSDYPELTLDEQGVAGAQTEGTVNASTEEETEQSSVSASNTNDKAAALGKEFELLLNIDGTQPMQPTTGRRQLQRYLVGLLSYASDPWNVVDISSLTVVTASILRWICHADIALNTELAAVGTFLLWVRVIGYLNGLDMTAAYVRMTMAVISDMMPFMLILVLLIVGNAFVLLLLYPQSLELDDSDSGSGWHLGDEDEETIDDAFGDFSAALFTVRCCFLLQQTKLTSASVASPLCLWHRFPTDWLHATA
jgi:hypothetical protein